MLHALFIAICAIAVVFFPVRIHGLIVDLRKQKGLIEDLTLESHKHQHAPSPNFIPARMSRLHGLSWAATG